LDESPTAKEAGVAEFFGDIERFLADLYPYRWPLTILALLVLTGVAAFAYRKGWHLLVWQHRTPVAIIGTPVLLLLIAVGWWLGSPLFTSKTVVEEFPFAAAAEVPSGMSRDAVEQAMSTMAKLDSAMTEAMPEMMESGIATKLKSGSFRDADSFHRGSGLATIYRGPDGKHLLRLDSFSVTNGPELHVMLSPHPDPTRGSEVRTSGYAELGILKGNKGDQNYEIPDNVNVSVQRSVVIYCKPFSVVFSVATLNDAS
jgi:hypothetical protein